jgi:SAM-dependent methyltransferase
MPELHYFTQGALEEWTRIGQRHNIRDRIFLRDLARCFHRGSVLELGAATGHLSAILHEYGYDVTASDVSPKFVEAIASRGVKARIVDATRSIAQQTGSIYANILAQNVLPLILRDRATVLATLRQIHAALEPSGRAICISAHARRGRNSDAYFSPREQIDIARASGLFKIVKLFPHQVLPPGLYRNWNASLLNFLDHACARVGSVRLVWIMEKTETEGCEQR